MRINQRKRYFRTMAKCFPVRESWVMEKIQQSISIPVVMSQRMSLERLISYVPQAGRWTHHLIFKLCKNNPSPLWFQPLLVTWRFASYLRISLLFEVYHSSGFYLMPHYTNATLWNGVPLLYIWECTVAKKGMCFQQCNGKPMKWLKNVQIFKLSPTVAWVRAASRFPTSARSRTALPIYVFYNGLTQ